MSTDEERRKSRHSLFRKVNTVRGICEVLREVYDDVFLLPDGEQKTRMTEHLVDAFVMAKKMNERLNYYKDKYTDTSGHNASNLEVRQNNHWRIRLRFKRPVW